MTPDEQARAEAEQRWPNSPDHDDTRIRLGRLAFEEGAAWQRSQPVEAALKHLRPMPSRKQVKRAIQDAMNASEDRSPGVSRADWYTDAVLALLTTPGGDS